MKRIFILLFSIMMAWGNWTPFTANNASEGSVDSGTGIIQILSAFFIVYLFYKFKNQIFAATLFGKKYLFCLYLIVIVSTLVNSISDLSVSVWVYLAKFFLSIVLFLAYPLYIGHDRQLFFRSLLWYSVTCALLSICFFLGFFDQYSSFHSGRLFLFGENPNSTSCRIGLGVLFLFYTLYNNFFGWGVLIRITLALLIVPMLGLIVAGGSRGSFLILIVSIFLILLLSNKKNPYVKYISIGLVVCMLLGTLSYFINNSDFALKDRLLSSLEEGDDGGRKALNEKAFAIYSDYPVLGTGVAKFPKEMYLRYRETRTVHNFYYYILVVSGVIGFSVFMIFIWKMFFVAYRMRYENILLLISLLYMLLIAYKTGGILTYLLMWYVFSFVPIFINISKYEK